MLRLRDGVSRADTDTGIALLDENSGMYWNLNGTGALVLRTLLEDGGTQELAVRRLTGEYAVDSDSARADVLALVEQLGTSGLVEEEGRSG
ncbi:lasso peptide biosynthesis PqqD family chaperone [Streptomyces sp. NPDC048172]|uniref:lasso peptide biosynthesis PqqD family chaperone n=1 Tax=Streptomyces sp. NPDC048172 TaxID=3365505 RepID=UPI00371B1DAD